ncbi:hypothetical protein LIER_30645 [Lithospermum erythrorhizon]|uniref:Reverse transcriptase zinc-binding domain-containing protein n=1 Tax=Lithospermum erythrorhizon TaxID=34254 RepID=A0AAV3RS34_LITER
MVSDKEDEYIWLDPPEFTQRFMWNELRMSTKDRLLQWNNNVTPGCLFCSSPESQEHLFFLCSYAGHTWRLILQSLHLYRANQGWSLEQQWCAEHLRGKCLRKRLM